MEISSADSTWACYKFPDFRTETSHTFCTAGNGINCRDMKTQSLSKFIRGLITDIKSLIPYLKAFTIKNFEHFDT